MSVTTSLSLNQDLSAKNLRLRTDNSGALDMTKRQAWLKAMEQSQMQEWLRQGLTARGRHDTPVAEGRSNVLELSQTFHHDDAEKNGDLETVSDAQADSRSNRTGKQATSTDVAQERDRGILDEKASEFLPAARSAQRSSADPAAAEVGNESSQLKQQASGSVMASSLASSPSAVLPSITVGSAMLLASEFAQGGQAVQAIKMALQEMTGIEARIVSAESLNQMADVDRQASQLASKLVTGLSVRLTDTAALEKSEPKEESASLEVTDKTESPLEERQAIRFHAEWSEEGLRLWLGIDSNANVNKALLAKQLHDWVTKQNVQLLALIWNGEQLPKNVMTQLMKDGGKPSTLALTHPQNGDVANAQGAEDTHYFLNSYLQAKEMQWPSVQ